MRPALLSKVESPRGHSPWETGTYYLIQSWLKKTKAGVCIHQWLHVTLLPYKFFVLSFIFTLPNLIDTLTFFGCFFSHLMCFTICDLRICICFENKQLSNRSFESKSINVIKFELFLEYFHTRMSLLLQFKHKLNIPFRRVETGWGLRYGHDD